MLFPDGETHNSFPQIPLHPNYKPLCRNSFGDVKLLLLIRDIFSPKFIGNEDISGDFRIIWSDGLQAKG